MGITIAKINHTIKSWNTLEKESESRRERDMNLQIQHTEIENKF